MISLLHTVNQSHHLNDSTKHQDKSMKRVQVYYNIRRGNYSVRQSGRVIDHVKQIVLRDVRFNVAPAGRDKVRETGVKNVHATVTGFVVVQSWRHIPLNESKNYDFVAYNPFKYDQFVKITSNGYDGFYADPVHNADYAVLLPTREIRAWGVK